MPRPNDLKRQELRARFFPELTVHGIQIAFAWLERAARDIPGAVRQADDDPLLASARHEIDMRDQVSRRSAFQHHKSGADASPRPGDLLEKVRVTGVLYFFFPLAAAFSRLSFTLNSTTRVIRS